MGKAESRTKDAAMAANLLRTDGRPDRVKARKENRFNAAMNSILRGGPGTSKQQRRTGR